MSDITFDSCTCGSVVVPSAEAVAELQAENERLRAALRLWLDASKVDATMEGPVFMGVSMSALGRKAWAETVAALEEDHT